MLMELSMLALLVVGGGGILMAGGIVDYMFDREVDAERERCEQIRAMETKKALKETLEMIEQHRAK